MFCCPAIGLEDDDFDATIGTDYLPEHVSFCYQWNMGISLGTGNDECDILWLVTISKFSLKTV